MLCLVSDALVVEDCVHIGSLDAFPVRYPGRGRHAMKCRTAYDLLCCLANSRLARRISRNHASLILGYGSLI